MCDICGDNRFEIIEAYKRKLIEATNIEASPEEMAVIDNILFRFWQMGWLPSAQPERKKGKWTERHHAYSDEEQPIEEWQSCKCSECGRYDTRPYLYYFSEPRFCSWCGAEMEGEQDG